jgi:hypothetical protein
VKRRPLPIPSRLELLKIWLLDPRTRYRIGRFKLNRRSLLASGAAVWMLYAGLMWQLGEQPRRNCTTAICRALLGGLPFDSGPATSPAPTADPGPAGPAPGQRPAGGSAPATGGAGGTGSGSASDPASTSGPTAPSGAPPPSGPAPSTTTGQVGTSVPPTTAGSPPAAGPAPLPTGPTTTGATTTGPTTTGPTTTAAPVDCKKHQKICECKKKEKQCDELVAAPGGGEGGDRPGTQP